MRRATNLGIGIKIAVSILAGILTAIFHRLRSFLLESNIFMFGIIDSQLGHVVRSSYGIDVKAAMYVVSLLM